MNAAPWCFLMNHLLALLFMRLTHCYRYYPVVRPRRARFLFTWARSGALRTGMGGALLTFCGSLSLGGPLVLKTSRVRRYSYGFNSTLASQKTVAHVKSHGYTPTPTSFPLAAPLTPYGGWGSKVPHRELLRAQLARGCSRTVSGGSHLAATG